MDCVHDNWEKIYIHTHSLIVTVVIKAVVVSEVQFSNVPTRDKKVLFVATVG